METRKIVETQKEESISKKKTGKKKIKQKVVKITGQKTKVNKINKAIQNEKLKKRKEEKKRTYRNILKNENGIKNPFSQRQILEERRKKEIRDLLKKNISTRKKMKGGSTDMLIQIYKNAFGRIPHNFSTREEYTMKEREYVTEQLHEKMIEQFDRMVKLGIYKDNLPERQHQLIQLLDFDTIVAKVNEQYQILQTYVEDNGARLTARLKEPEKEKALRGLDLLSYKDKAEEKYIRGFHSEKSQRRFPTKEAFIINDLDMLIQERDTELGLKDSVIKHCRKEFKEGLEAIQIEKDEQIAEVRAQLERNEKSLAEKDKELDGLRKELREKESYIRYTSENQSTFIGSQITLFKEEHREKMEALTFERDALLPLQEKMSQLQEQMSQLQEQRHALLTLLISPPTPTDLQSLLDGYQHQYDTLSPMLEADAHREFTATIEAKKGVLNLLNDSYAKLFTEKTELQTTVSLQSERVSTLEAFCLAGEQALITNQALIDAQAEELKQIKAAAQNSEAKEEIDDLSASLEFYQRQNATLEGSLQAIEVEKKEEYAKTLARTEKLKQNLQKLSAIQAQVDQISDEEIIEHLQRLQKLEQQDETSGAIDELVLKFGTLIYQLNSKHSMELQTTHSRLRKELDNRLAEQLSKFEDAKRTYLEEREQQIREEVENVKGELIRVSAEYQHDLSEIEKKHKFERVALDARVSEASLAQITSEGLQKQLDTTLSELEAVKKSLLEANRKALADLAAQKTSLSKEIGDAKKSEAARLQGIHRAELSEVRRQNEEALLEEQVKSKRLEKDVESIRASLSSAEATTSEQHKRQEEDAKRQVEALKAEHTQKIKEATARGDAAAVERLRKQAAASENTYREEVARINREKESLKTELAANVAQLQAKVTLHAQATEQLTATQSAISDAEARALQQVETLKVEHAKAIAEARKSGDDAAVTRLSESYQAQAAELERNKLTEIDRIRQQLISDNINALSDASAQHRQKIDELNAKHTQEIAAATETGKDALRGQHQKEIRVLKQSHEEEQQRITREAVQAKDALTQKEGELRERDKLIESHAEKIREKMTELEKVQNEFTSSRKRSEKSITDLQLELKALNLTRDKQIAAATEQVRLKESHAQSIEELNRQLREAMEEKSQTTLQLHRATANLQAAVANAQEVSVVTADFKAKLARKEQELATATALADTLNDALAEQQTELERRVSEATNQATTFIGTAENRIAAADERVRLAEQALREAQADAVTIVDKNLRNIDAAKAEASKLVSKAQEELRVAKEHADAAKTQHEQEMSAQQLQLDAVRNELFDLTAQKDGEIKILNKSFSDAHVALESFISQTKDKDALLQSQRDRILELEGNVNEISQLKIQLSEKDASLAEFNKSIAEEKRSLQATTSETIQALQTQLQQNKGKLLEKEERVTALSKELKNLQDDNDLELKRLKSEYTTLLTQRDDLFATNTIIIGTNESNVQTLESLNLQLQKKQATIQQLKDTNAGIEEALQDVTTRNDSLIKQLDLETRTNSEKIRDLETSLRAMEGTNKSIGELTEELESLKSTNKENDAALKELNRQNSLLQEGKSAVETSLAEEKEAYIKTIQSLEQEKAATKSSLDEVNAQLSEQQETNSSLAEEKERYSRKIQSLEQEKAAAKSILDEVNARLSTQEETNSSLAEEKETYIRTIQSLEEEKAAAKSSLDEVNAQLIAQQATNLSLAQQKETDRIRLNDLEQKKAAAESRLSQVNVQLIAQEETNTTLARRNLESIRQLDTEKNVLVTQLQATSADRDKIAGERDTIAVDRDAVTGERDTIRAERDEIATRITELEQGNEEQLRTLREELRRSKASGAAAISTYTKQKDQLAIQLRKFQDLESKIASDEQVRVQTLLQHDNELQTVRSALTSEKDKVLEATQKMSDYDVQEAELNDLREEKKGIITRISDLEAIIGRQTDEHNEALKSQKGLFQLKLEENEAILKTAFAETVRGLDQQIVEERKYAQQYRAELEANVLTISMDKAVVDLEKMNLSKALQEVTDTMETLQKEKLKGLIVKRFRNKKFDEKIRAQRKLIRELNIKFNTTQDELTDLRRGKETYNKTVSTLETEKYSAREELTKMGKEADERVAASQRTAAELAQKLAAAEQRLEAAETEMARAKQSAVAAADTSASTQQALQTAIKRISDKEKAFQAEVESLRNQVSEAQEEVTRLGEQSIELKETRATLELSQEAKVEAEREIEDLRKQLTSKGISEESLSAKIKEAEDKLSAATENERILNEKIIGFSKQISGLVRKATSKADLDAERISQLEIDLRSRAEEQVTTLREAERIRTIDLERKQQEIEDTKSSYKMIEGQLIVNQEKLRISEAKLKDIEKIKADSKEINEQFDINQKRLGRNKLELKTALEENIRLQKVETSLRTELQDLNVQYGQLVAEKEQISKAAIRDIRVLKQKRLEDIHNLKLQQERDNKETELAERRHNEALTETAEIWHNEALDELRQQLLDKDAQHRSELVLFSAAVDEAEAKNAEIELQLNSLTPLFIETNRRLDEVLRKGVLSLRKEVEQMSETIASRGTDKIQRLHADLRQKIADYRGGENEIDKLEELLNQKLQLFQELTGTLSEEIGKKEDENSRLSGELQTEKISVAGNLQRIREQEQTIKQSQSELVAEREQIDKLKKENEAQMLILRFRKRRETQKDATIEIQLQQLQQTQSDLDARGTTILRQLQDLDESKRNLELERAKVVKLNDTLQEKENKISKQLTIIDAQEETLLSQEQGLNRKQEEIRRKGKLIEEQQQEFLQRESVLRGVITDSHSAFEGSQVELDKKTKDVADGLRQLELSQQNLDAEKKKVDLEKAKVAEQLEIIKQQQSEISNLQKDFQDELDSEISKLQKEILSEIDLKKLEEKKVEKLQEALSNEIRLKQAEELKIGGVNQTTIDEKNGRIQQLEQELRLAKGTVTDRNDTIIALQQQLGTQQQKVGTQGNEIIRLQGELGNRDGTIGTLQEDIRKTKGALANRQSVLKIAEDELTAEQRKVSARDNTIAGLHGELGNRDDTIGTLQRDIGIRDNTIGTLQGDIGTLRGNIGIRDNTIGTLQATLATEQQKVLDREVTIGTEQQKVVARDVSIGQLQALGLRKDSDIRGLRDDIVDLRLEINQKLGQLQLNKIGIERFQDQLDKAVADKTAVDAQLRKSQATISDLENNHLKAAQNNIDTMRSKLAELQSETKAYQNSCPAAFQVPLPNASKYQVTITVRNKPRRLEQQHSKTVKN